MFIIKLRNWMIPFKLARLLVMHDSEKLTRVGRLSLKQSVYKAAGRVTLLLG